MTDPDKNIDVGPKVEISRWAIGEIPPYFATFIKDNGPIIVNVLRKGDQQGIRELLGKLSGVLPTDNSFKEILSLICVRENGDLFVACTKGDFERIDSKKATEILDQLSQEVPVDTDEVLILHDHPSRQLAIGPTPTTEVGFSDEDKNAISFLGGRLRILDLKNVFVGLVTANSSRALLLQSKNEGRAFGWSFTFDENRE